MDWKIGGAKQRFSEVVRQAASDPQSIYNRDHPVAAVISAESLEAFGPAVRNPSTSTFPSALPDRLRQRERERGR
jgi:antitoxin (DNA-binding transcriptional repressor) of toxin-antitoxin stability system